VSARDATARNGAQLLCEALVRQGVKVLFGIPGGAIMPFYHALPEYAGRLRHVLCRHEQGAGHAAEGYARASGRVGVCVATSGPGATNHVTPIADAWMDSTPLVAITGQVTGTAIGTDAFQETDIVGITAPITKYSWQLRDPGDIPRVIAAAFRIASTGRTGPVLVDVTKDAQQARVVPDWNATLDLTGYVDPCAQPLDESALDEVARLLDRAERPLILAGNGVVQSGAHRELRALAERGGIPVITTLHGKGGFPDDHLLALGMPGMHGWVHVNRAIQACDLLVNVGSRFDDRVTGKTSSFAPRATIVHVDVDPYEIGKVVRADVGLVGDARAVLERLAARVTPRTHAAWLAHIRGTQQLHQARQRYGHRPRTAALMPHDVYDGLDRAIAARGACRVVTDVGQHQMWAAQLIGWSRPRTHITSGGAGTMGFALPAALGAALACPDETIWAIVGDGGFQMMNQELATMRQEGIRNVKVAIVNNGYLGMVRQRQELFERKRYSGTPHSGPDFKRLAEAYGVRGLTVEHLDQVECAIATAWDTDDVVVIDFRVEREANVFPIVPQGRSIGEMLVDVATEAGP
jgi:acetolactate synthase-1/2/3 large subunit